MKPVWSIAIVLMLLCTVGRAEPGRCSVSTNLLDYARLATFNLDGSYALSRHWSLSAGARYNPFTFREGEPRKQFQYRQRSYSLGVRWWPWHTWSGWWLSGKVRYQEYNIGGIVSSRTEEGDRGGVGLYAGYSHMLTQHLNLEFGLGMWGGMSWYKIYSCPSCGLTLENGRKWFARPDDVMMSLVYVF